MISSGSIYSSLLSRKGEFQGIAFDSLALGLSMGLSQWLPVGVVGNGVSTGMLGSGTVVGSLDVPDGFGVYLAGLSGVGISGPLGISFAEVLNLGLSDVFRSVQYTGIVSVGSGSDVSYFSGDMTLEGYLISSLSSSGVFGVMAPSLALGVSNGVRGHIGLMVGHGSVLGAPSLISGAVPSLTRLV